MLRYAVSPYSYFRVQSPVTALLGPEYRRSRTCLEIDLTWSCNLRCYNCNRSCGQAPTAERLKVDQIHRLVDENVATGQRWKRIRLLGGEPTLHPEFKEILEILITWKHKFSPETRLEITTNGYGRVVQKALTGIPSDVVIHNTNKVRRPQPFRSFNVAPKDCMEYAWADYTNGCRVMKNSGVGFTPYGWYVCPVAGGIDRIIGLDLGLKQFPAQNDDMDYQLKAFCRLCGHFKRLYGMPVRKPLLSKTWEEAYHLHRIDPPQLTRY